MHFLNLHENLFRAFDNKFKNLVNSDIWNQYIYRALLKIF